MEEGIMFVMVPENGHIVMVDGNRKGSLEKWVEDYYALDPSDEQEAEEIRQKVRHITEKCTVGVKEAFRQLANGKSWVVIWTACV